jgi:hypothetical protein
MKFIHQRSVNISAPVAFKNKPSFASGLFLKQLPIKRTTRKFLKALRSNAFKNFLGLDLSAKRCYNRCL